MEQNNNNSHFSATDIQKYLEGKLSAPEMHAIEKAALNDPFLADAIEGMQNDLQSENNSSFNTDVAELNERLQNRIHKNNKIAIMDSSKTWQRVAAAAIILVGSTILIYNYVIKKTDKNNAVAITKENKIADTLAAKNNPSAATIKNDSPAVSDLASNENNKQKKLTERKPKKAFSNVQNDDKKLSARGKNIDSLKERKFEKTSVNEIVKKDEVQRKMDISVKADTLITDSLKNQLAANNAPVSSLQSKVAGISLSRNKLNKNNFVQGIVIDNYKNPVSGATVMFKNRKTSTSTDNNGFFKLKTDYKEKMSNVVVNSLGFESTTIFLDNNNDSTTLIQLKPSTSALNDVVVVGYAAKTEDDNDKEELAYTPKKEKEISYKAAPAVGWPAFNDYILQNKKITTADSTKKGKEIITFFVDTTNQLSSFKIRKSLSRAHDAETIRLIKQGPAWKLLKGKKAKVILAIEF